jgi:hypothetical protein
LNALDKTISFNFGFSCRAYRNLPAMLYLVLPKRKGGGKKQSVSPCFFCEPCLQLGITGQVPIMKPF